MDEKTKGRIGIGLYVMGMGMGLLLLLYYFGLKPWFIPGISAGQVIGIYVTMAEMVFLAFPACFVYMTVPVIVDRYDPEPWWALAMVFLWGAVAACGFSVLINSNAYEVWALFGFDDLFSGIFAKKLQEDIIGAVISAPFTEEFFKGIIVLGVFLFARREFDGVVDGVIYATFVALGFAATENVIYYARADMKGGLTAVFIIRGILGPWGHPLYTSMLGVGVGMARETNRTWLKWAAPIGGYFMAVFLHACWNGSAVVSGVLRFPLIFLMLPLWFLFVGLFGIIVLLLVRREGKIIRQHLKDEVLMGNITQQELDLICSPIGRIRAMFGGVPGGRKFVDVASRLGLAKWHTARAMKGQKRTISADFLVPLRQELYALRAKHARR